MDARDTGRRPPGLGVVFSVVLLDLLGFGILIPQLGVYAVRFGASPLVAGLLLSTYSLMQLVFAPVLGALSDRVGRRPVLLVSIAGSCVGYLLFGFADSLWLLFVARLVDGASGGNISAAQAYVADVTAPEERARGMGMVGAAMGLGFILGPAVGGVLGHWGGNRAIGLFAAALAAGNLVWALLRLPESRRAGGGGAGAARGLGAALRALGLPGVGLCLALVLLFATAFSVMEGTFSVFMVGHFSGGGPVAWDGGWLALRARAAPEALRLASLRTGVVFAVVGVAGTLVQGLLVRRLVARAGEAPLVVAGLGLVGVGLLGLPAVASAGWGWGWLLPAMGVVAVGQGLVAPSLASLVTRAAPEGRTGEVLGAFQACGALGRVLGPALGGLAFGAAGAWGAFGAGAAALLVPGLALGVVLARAVRRHGGAR